ncbi:MAG: aromatic acid decarboxylase, partial [Nitrospirae bacterium]
MKRYVLGITGTTGVVLGLRVLEVLSKVSEVHLVVSKVAGPIIKDETGKNIEDFISNT